MSGPRRLRSHLYFGEWPRGLLKCASWTSPHTGWHTRGACGPAAAARFAAVRTRSLRTLRALAAWLGVLSPEASEPHPSGSPWKRLKCRRRLFVRRRLHSRAKRLRPAPPGGRRLSHCQAQLDTRGVSGARDAPSSAADKPTPFISFPPPPPPSTNGSR